MDAKCQVCNKDIKEDDIITTEVSSIEEGYRSMTFYGERMCPHCGGNIQDVDDDAPELMNDHIVKSLNNTDDVFRTAVLRNLDKVADLILNCSEGRDVVQGLLDDLSSSVIVIINNYNASLIKK